MDGRNGTIEGKKFTTSSGLAMRRFPLGAAGTDVFDGGRAQVTGGSIADLVHGVGDNGEVFVARPGESVYASTDFAILVG